jgi:predicted AAA+ superfamily ATPase
LRGNLIETLAIANLYKHYYNSARTPCIYFWRDQSGHEIDCILEKATELIPIEIKANKTVSYSFFDGLSYWNKLAGREPSKSFVIYAGNEKHSWAAGTILGCQYIDDIFKG